jgi:hypothetical protein
MCLAVYLAAVRPLPLILWDEARPAFHVTEVGSEEPVRGRFGLPHVYRLASSEGCGCSFEYGVWPVDNDEDRLREAKGRASVTSLAAYVAAAERVSPLQLYACWEGEQELPVRDEGALCADGFAKAEFQLVQRRLLRTVVPSGQA